MEEPHSYSLGDFDAGHASANWREGRRRQRLELHCQHRCYYEGGNTPARLDDRFRLRPRRHIRRRQCH